MLQPGGLLDHLDKELSLTFFKSTIGRQHSRGLLVHSKLRSESQLYYRRQENLRPRAVVRNAPNLHKEPGI